MGYVFNADWFNVSMLYEDIIKNNCEIIRKGHQIAFIKK